MVPGRQTRAGSAPPATRAVFAALVLAALAGVAGVGVGARSMAGAQERGTGRFVALDVFLTGETPLAAYQLEIRDPAGTWKIVGIEGGEHPAFSGPPYHDPAALAAGERIVLAAFDTRSDLPLGRTRVATLHVRIPAGTRLESRASVTVAAGADGAAMPIQISVEPRS